MRRSKTDVILNLGVFGTHTVQVDFYWVPDEDGRMYVVEIRNLEMEGMYLPYVLWDNVNSLAAIIEAIKSK